MSRAQSRQALGAICVVLALVIVAAWTGAAFALEPSRFAASRFSGKFELVPLFDAGHRPVLDNGHTDYAERNRIGFRTEAGDLIVVPAGAPTDLASIPRFVWPLMPPDGPYAEAAAFHDECYRTRGAFDRYGLRGRNRAAPYDRGGCDEILREAMVALGVPWGPRVPIWAAVRLFGGAGWGS